MTNDNELIALLDRVDALRSGLSRESISYDDYTNAVLNTYPTLSAALRERLDIQQDYEHVFDHDGQCVYCAEYREDDGVPSSLAGDKVEGKLELEEAYHAAVRAGLSSAEGRTFEQWRDKVSDYGLDDAQQALAVERERAK